MSSSMYYSPRITPKIKEELISMYNNGITNLVEENTRAELNLGRIQGVIKQIKNDVALIGRSEECITIDMQKINETKTFHFKGEKIDSSETLIQPDEIGSVWEFIADVNEQYDGYWNRIKASFFDSRENADKAMLLLKKIKSKDISIDELDAQYEKLIYNTSKLTNDEKNLILEYSLGKCLLGEEGVYSYEEAIDNIDSVRGAVEKHLVSEYQQHIIEEACEYVGIKTSGILSNGIEHCMVNEVDDCEIEITYFDNQEVLFETVGIVEAAGQQSMDEKRKLVASAQNVCSKLSQMQEYIAKVYPDVSMKIVSAKMPSENNIKIANRFKDSRIKKRKEYKHLGSE